MANRRWGKCPLVGVLLTVLAAAMLTVSAVSPADDETQPEFSQHKFSRLQAKARASHTFPGMRIFPAVSRVEVPPPADHAETLLLSRVAPALAGFNAVHQARSPPNL